MLDIDAGKLLIVGIIALLVIGPKELPRVLRQLGQWTGRLRRMANEFQGQFMDAMREADLESIRTEVANVAAAAKVDASFDPAADVHKELTGALEWKPADGVRAETSALPPPGEATASTGMQAGTPAAGTLEAASSATDIGAGTQDPGVARPPVRSAGKPKILKMSPRANAVAAAARRKTARKCAVASSAVRKRCGALYSAPAAAPGVAGATPES